MITNKAKIMLITWCLFFSISLCFSSTTPILDGKSIDLLTGTPTGISEPLDTRRTRQQKLDLSDLLIDNLRLCDEVIDISWQEVQIKKVDSQDSEEVVLDLLSKLGVDIQDLATYSVKLADSS